MERCAICVAEKVQRLQTTSCREAWGVMTGWPTSDQHMLCAIQREETCRSTNGLLVIRLICRFARLLRVIGDEAGAVGRFL